MKYIIHDKKYSFKSAFDTETGSYVRTGILDENGNDTFTNGDGFVLRVEDPNANTGGHGSADDWEPDPEMDGYFNEDVTLA